MATQLEPGPSSARPTGTVTFLFSDIEGSASRWDGDRQAMAAALTRHDELMRASLEAHGAYVFKTMGDAFCAVFARAEDAIAAALDAQCALVAEDFSTVDGLHVRMAVHTGTADERNGDYFGPAVNRVARLLAIGHGGQVLVSGTAADLLQGEMPAQSSLRDLGAHRLRDLARPEQVYQLVSPDIPEQFSALRSLDELPNNLPRQLTSFVGRDDVVGEVAALIDKFPLVTLVGTGGAGKTRCAIQIGAELLDGSADGVWLVELAQITEPGLVASVVAKALNVEAQTDRPMLESLLVFLKRKRLLLIVDNCEHVIDEARDLVSAILQGCPDVRVLATSREGLNIAGEQTYRMPSLGVPKNVQHVMTEGTSRYGAIQLFVDRAVASDKRFALTEENAPHVAEICRRLDGIPLAIELAAARVKVLSPQQLERKLDERFRVLTGGDRSALPRQQTMRALIDWSYDLLSAEERALFRRLSIFAGGFTLESVAAVCGDETIDEIAVLDLLSSLVDKSLVQSELMGSDTRYRLLESTRQYARDKLTEAGEYDAVALKHAMAYLALAQGLDETWELTPERAWRAEAEAELENFRAALAWGFGPRGDALLAQQLVGAAKRVWSTFAMSEGLLWVQTARERVSEDTPAFVPAALDLTDAVLLGGLTLYKAAVPPAERALAFYRELGDGRHTVESERALGVARLSTGGVSEGQALLENALPSARELGLRRTAIQIVRTLAVGRAYLGDADGARRLYAEALSSARAAGTERLALSIAMNLAETEFSLGKTAEALRLVTESLAAFPSIGEQYVRSVGMNNLSAYLIALERYEEARTQAREALTAARDMQYRAAISFALQHLAAIDVLRNSGSGETADFDRAAHILGYTDAQFAAWEVLREATEQQEYDKIVPVLRASLGADELAKFMAEGGAWSEDQAIAAALEI